MVVWAPFLLWKALEREPHKIGPVTPLMYKERKRRNMFQPVEQLQHQPKIRRHIGCTYLRRQIQKQNNNGSQILAFELGLRNFVTESLSVLLF
eukprot:1138644-Pelagomonas_calceolata.AAC.2